MASQNLTDICKKSLIWNRSKQRSGCGGWGGWLWGSQDDGARKKLQIYKR